MKRVIFAFAGTITGLVLLLSFKTQPGTTAAATPPAAVSGAAAGTSPGTSSGTVDGDSADTRFGPVQVRITVENGKLTSVTAVEYPTENPRDQEINSYAIPQLNEEAAQAGSADIDTVSGATYTSDGYVKSLQSALDKAGIS
ncbi:FMN-binding domain-containing protein [Amycolatopsis pretoriensis]|uniref:FMN-binding domain-containing protein n=1 Tax=Amycolatopsis pretoriensis TaxID=218821 RepID=A0A1H5RHF5_9PSEU|nr:FMN-binding protein [Amycolatopsis pretoriensis]SEF37816.1 FMN-binding domain-containing protein [Amycolatopsis pretoriensis]